MQSYISIIFYLMVFASIPFLNIPFYSNILRGSSVLFLIVLNSCFPNISLSPIWVLFFKDVVQEIYFSNYLECHSFQHLTNSSFCATGLIQQPRSYAKIIHTLYFSFSFWKMDNSCKESCNDMEQKNELIAGVRYKFKSYFFYLQRNLDCTASQL